MICSNSNDYSDCTKHSLASQDERCCCSRYGLSSERWHYPVRLPNVPVQEVTSASYTICLQSDLLV